MGLMPKPFFSNILKRNISSWGQRLTHLVVDVVARHLPQSDIEDIRTLDFLVASHAVLVLLSTKHLRASS